MIKRRRLKLSMAVVAMLLLASVLAPAVAGGTGAAPVATARLQGPADPAELEAFMDDLLAKDMAEHHIAGATVSVVKEGKLLLAKGYGYADLDKGVPVDPERTGFYVGSVTKLFTWTAVMQLVEQGKLDLDADINTYLDFRIPDTYPQPITLAHLLAHTPGFEDRFYEVLAADVAAQAPAREWLVSHMPARVRPPGEAAAYSNYGASLAGYIVARVSGQSYEQYIQDHILGPLGMAHSTVQSPRPPELRAQASRGYSYTDGALRAFTDYLGQPAFVPAGAMSASAADMARFMIAHLEDGRYSDAATPEARILQSATAQRMHTTLYTPHPRLLGNAHGFFDFTDNGRRTLGHSGETYPFNTLLLLLPDERVGVFVSYNSEGGGALTNQHLGFQRAFFDHYYPAAAVDPPQPAADRERAGRFVGSYRLTRSSYTTFEKVSGLVATVQIKDAGDGALLFSTPWGEWRHVQVEPLYYRQVDGPFSIAFREDGQGRISYMYADLTPMFAFEKLHWYETPAFNMALLLVSALLFLSTVVVAAIRAIRNRRRGRDRGPSPRGLRAAGGVLLALSVLNLLFLAGTMMWGVAPPLFGVSAAYKVVLGLGVLSAVLTLGALAYTALAWKNGSGGLGSRAYYTLVTLAAVAFVWFLNHWNLLGWRF